MIFLRFLISIPIAILEALDPEPRKYSHTPPEYINPPTMPPPKPVQ